MNNGASDVETYLDNSERRHGNHWIYYFGYRNTLTNQVIIASKKTANSAKFGLFDLN